MDTSCYPKWPADLRSDGANLKTSLRTVEAQQRQLQEGREQAAEQAAISYVLEQLGPAEIDRLLKEALGLLPEPIVRRNPTLSNPFVRSKVYELACGDPRSLIFSFSVDLILADSGTSCMKRIGSLLCSLACNGLRTTSRSRT